MGYKIEEETGRGILSFVINIWKGINECDTTYL